MKPPTKTTAATGHPRACVAGCAGPVLLTAGLISTGGPLRSGTWLPVLSAVLIGAATRTFVPTCCRSRPGARHRRRPRQRQRQRLPSRSGAGGSR